MKQSGFGITSMILGIISLLSSCVVGGIPIVLGILGIIFATVAMCQKDRAHGTAIAGLTCYYDSNSPLYPLSNSLRGGIFFLSVWRPSLSTF